MCPQRLHWEPKINHGGGIHGTENGRGFPGGPVVKNPPASEGDTGLIPCFGEIPHTGATKPGHHNEEQPQPSHGN